MSLIGTLEEIKLADVLRLFASGKKDGVLTVSSGEQRAQMRFQKGAIVSAFAGRFRGDEAVLDLFGWKEGQLTFVPEDKALAPNVSRDVDSLILEGLRVGDTFHRIKTLIPSDRVVFQLAPDPGEQAQITLGRAEWRVVQALDGIRDVREVVDASRQPRAEVLKTLVELAEAGFVERTDVQKSLRVQSEGLFAKDTAAVDERLERDWAKVARFARGVLRVEVSGLSGKVVTLPVEFRPGLIRDVHLPRSVVAELNVAEGEDVTVRPVA
jgi:hypothetical protein